MNIYTRFLKAADLELSSLMKIKHAIVQNPNTQKGKKEMYIS
jgi:hypothetical protein